MARGSMFRSDNNNGLPPKALTPLKSSASTAAMSEASQRKSYPSIREILTHDHIYATTKFGTSEYKKI